MLDLDLLDDLGQPVLHISQRQPIHHAHSYKYGQFV
jgi:hypothetical protein